MVRPRGTIEQMQKLARQRGGKCLSGAYVNTFTKLTWQCVKGHTWKATPTHIKHSKSWCPKCAGTKRLTMEDMQVVANAKGGVCLSEKYLNQKTKLKWECAKGHVFLMAPGNVRNQKQWCPKCAGRASIEIEDMRSLAVSRAGECLTQTCTSSRDKLVWRCEENHQWRATPHDVKRGSWCPECPRGFGERLCRIIFETMFGEKFPNTKPKWLKNDRGYLMELDGYCEKLKLAFEYQGQGHYLLTSFHRTEKSLFNRRADDSFKRQTCKTKGITLIEVPYKIRFENMYQFIVDACNKKSVSVPEHEYTSLEKLRSYTGAGKIAEMKKVASAQSGHFVSDKYLGSHEKHIWQCAKGHTWKSRPYSVKAGHWCPYCAGLALLTIDEMQTIAKERRGKCLSQEYKGNKEYLVWECAGGHVWSAIPNSIKRGRWCPTCAKENHSASIKSSQSHSQQLSPSLILANS